jgi:hypothetical protein
MMGKHRIFCALLQDITEHNGAVIFFYPKANTGGCTKQGVLGAGEQHDKEACQKLRPI